MTDVTESVDVNVPVATAYRQWTQFESFPQFMEGVESVTRTDARHTHWVTSVGGARREFDAEITEQNPDERIAWQSTGGDTSHAGVVTFHRITEDRTRVTVKLTWAPEGVVEKVGSMLNLDDRQVKADTERFKKFIEQGGTAGLENSGSAAPEDGQPAGQVGDIVDVLRGQHEEIKRAVARFQAASGEARGQLFGELADMLHAHETGEQQVVHPVTRQDATGGRQVAADRIEEERQAEKALAELRALGVDHPTFGDKFAVFHQAVLTHAAAEERQEFTRLLQLPLHRRQAMAEELRAAQNTPIPQ